MGFLYPICLANQVNFLGVAPVNIVPLVVDILDRPPTLVLGLIDIAALVLVSVFAPNRLANYSRS